MASHSVATDWHSKILKKEYQNWLAVGHALSLMCDGIRTYIEREMKAFHQALLANLASVPPCTCPRPPKHTCAWASQLARCHKGGKPTSPKFHQSDSSKWADPIQGYWEVAKLFMSDLGPSKATVLDASSTDCTGLTNLMFWCVYFRIQAHLIEAVRETRNNKWGHAPRQELTDLEKADALTAIRNLLQDPELAADNDAKSALAEINVMEKDFDAQSIERKVQADFQETVCGQLAGIEENLRLTEKLIADLKRNCVRVPKKVQKTQSALKRGQTKKFRLLQSINDKIEEERNRNISYPTQVINLVVWAFSECKNTFIANLCSLNSRSLALWMFMMVLLGSFKCLSHNSYNDGCPKESGSVPFDTKEFNFTRSLNTARESFTGRLWLYHELDSLLTKQGNVRGVVVIGEPGTGKSALTAQLICSRSSNPFIHKRIIGYHLCKYSDKATQVPGRFVRNLVDLMARRVPEYGMLVSNSSFILDILERSCLRDPYDCFEQAVAAPLRQLKNERRDYFIVIDALDECSSYDGGTAIAQFIEETFTKIPKWVRLVMTSRNDSTVLRCFTNMPKVYLSPKDVRNLQDIEIFIATKVFEDASFLDRLKVKLGFRSGDEIFYLTNKLLNQSQGNFLFVKEMFHFWKDDWNNQIDFNQLPKTIGGIYENYLRRVYGSREKFKPALAILEVMVAAFEPMPVDRLFQVLRVQDNIDYEYDFVYAMKGLSHFIRYGEDNTITLFHLSFTEWLTSRENLGNPYYVSRSHGHRRLAEYFLSVIRKTQNSSMDIYRLAQHVSFEGSDDNHLKEFENIDASYINASIDRDNRTLLHLAASNGNKKILQILIPSFESVDCEDSYGFTPGFVAAMSGLTENVEFLISKGANIEHRTKPPPSLHVLLADTMALADPIERAKTAFWNSSMLHAASSGGHVEVVQALLKRNASFLDVNGVNLTAIQLAAQNGHLKVVQLLYKCGALVDQVSLQHAAAGGHTNVVKFLLKTGVVDTCMRCDGSFYWLENRIRYQAKPHCNSGNAVDYILSDDKFKILCQSALHLAVARNHTEVVKLFLSREDTTVHCTDFTGRTPLHEAVRQNHVEMAELLIRGGARVSQNCRLFQNLSLSGNLTLKKCKTKYDFLSVGEEDEYNKDLCHCGSTPFLLAARYGHTEVGSLLLQYGAKSYDKDCQGATPLHVAACHGHYSFIKWLISRRPSLHINIRSKNQSTPLHSGAICKINEDIKPLIEMGASIFETDQYGMTPLHYSVLNAFENVETVFGTTRFFEPSGHLFITVWSSDGDVTVARDSYIVSRTVPLNVQCLKLLDLIFQADDSYLNKVDKNGRTALHLAAQHGEECCVSILLQKGASTDLTDSEGKTPLDVVTEFAPEVLKPCFFGKDSYEVDSFDLVMALNQRYHNAVAEILLSREAYLTQTCDKKQTYLLHRAFENEQPVIAYRILSRGGSLSCKDAHGRTPLLVYLQNGGKWLDVVLKRFDVTVHIECEKPFNKSEFHLLAFTKPTVPSENLLEYHTCDMDYCFLDDGPLLKAIKVHPLGFRVIDECRDAEGYTALHRAAQGGNLIMLQRFLSWGADPTVLTSQGHSALELAIMCAGTSPFTSIQNIDIAERAADLLFRAIRSTSRFDIGCNNSKAKLSIYHLSAYRGLSGFVKTLLNDTSLGVDINCSNVHGITPLYLAKLNLGTVDSSDGERDHWQEIVDLIEEYGGIPAYPSREVELNVIYRHLFGIHPTSFTIDELVASNEQFYERGASACRKRDLKYHQNGTLVNPYLKLIYTELARITALSSSVREKNFQLSVISRDKKELQRTLITILLDAFKAHHDISRLFEDIETGFNHAELMAIKRRNSIVNASTILSIKFPKRVKQAGIVQKLQLQKDNLNRLEKSLREVRFSWQSTKAIMSHMRESLRGILHRHRQFFGDISKLVHFLEKYDESQLCIEEIFQAELISIKFGIYVCKSRVDDLVSLLRHSFENGKHISRRIPSEWRKKPKSGWNLAVKFLYEQATHRDLAFDYLKDLSLGWDKETRIPLSVDALYRFD